MDRTHLNRRIQIVRDNLEKSQKALRDLVQDLRASDAYDEREFYRLSETLGAMNRACDLISEE